MNKRKNLEGQRFGKLVVKQRADNDKYNKSRWLCKCDCGHKVIVLATLLRQGCTKSCGCYRIMLHWKHGHNRKRNRTTEYTIWDSMKQRCNNKQHKNYKNYGARGITVCKRWLNSFENFLSDVGKRPSYKLTLDRIDNDGNYEPNNVRWATIEVQNVNKRQRIGKSK